MPHEKHPKTRVEHFPDSMALVRILYNPTVGHKMPFLVNMVYCGEEAIAK